MFECECGAITLTAAIMLKYLFGFSLWGFVLATPPLALLVFGLVACFVVAQIANTGMFEHWIRRRQGRHHRRMPAAGCA